MVDYLSIVDIPAQPDSFHKEYDSIYSCILPNASKDLLLFLRSYNISVNYAEYFSLPPGTALDIHVDNTPYSFKLADCQHDTKLNFCTNNGTMQWWDTSKADITISNHHNKHFMQFSSTKSVLRYKKTFTCALVNVGQPHNVINNSKQHWHCISYMLLDTLSQKPLQIHDAINRLNSYAR